MPVAGQALARHLVFVLEDGTPVVQRGANLVEVLETRELRVFNSFDHHHNITDEELKALQQARLVAHFDDVSVWLPAEESQSLDLGKARYYFLNTRLSSAYLKVVQSLLETSDLRLHYSTRTFRDTVVIMGNGDEPFSSLNDAEAALTLLKKALGKQLIGLSVDSMSIDTSLDDTQIKAPSWQKKLVSTMTLTNLGDKMILVIAPEDSHLPHLMSVLESLRMEMRLASTGEAALEIIMDEEPDLVLIDLALPDLHGYQVIAKLKKDPLTARTPIIAMSGSTAETDVAFAFYVAKVDEYLVKPVDAKLVRQRIINLLTKVV